VREFDTTSVLHSVICNVLTVTLCAFTLYICSYQLNKFNT
jgi:hypothetical protein